MIRLASCTVALRHDSIHDFFESVFLQASLNKQWRAPSYANEGPKADTDYILVFLRDLLALQFPEPQDPNLIQMLADARLLYEWVRPQYEEIFEVPYE